MIYFLYVSLVTTAGLMRTESILSDKIATPYLLWWETKPLVFWHNKTLKNIDGLEGILPEILRSVTNSCDGVMAVRSETFTDIQTKETERLLKITFSEAIGSRDLVMPIKLRNDKKSVLGMPFVKLLDSPGIAVVVKKTLAGTELLKAILMAWPILIFVVLSALLSGFFIWFLECRSNPQMFDPFCPKGVINGFWFTSVTMTTVGYGDVTPKTILGRLFTIIWICVGLVILAMYMGIVTTSLTTTRLEGKKHFYGITVAVVNRTDEEKFAILHNANLKVEKNELGVIDAVHRGKNGVKVGFLDFYLASYHSDLLYENKLDVVRVIPNNRAYGVLLGKDWAPEVVDCLRQHTDDNCFKMHELVPKYITVSEHRRGLTEYFSGSPFGYSIYALLGVLFLLIILGFGYDRGYCEWR